MHAISVSPAVTLFERKLQSLVGLCSCLTCSADRADTPARRTKTALGRRTTTITMTTPRPPRPLLRAQSPLSEAARLSPRLQARIAEPNWSPVTSPPSAAPRLLARPAWAKGLGLGKSKRDPLHGCRGGRAKLMAVLRSVAERARRIWCL